MIKIAIFLFAATLVGCGSIDTHQDQNQSIKIDVNKTTDITEVNQTIENNVTVVINPIDTGYYGDGTLTSPFTMMKAHYKIKSGDTWFISPILNANCTVSVRTHVRVTNIIIEDDKFDLIHYSFKSLNSIFTFDLNDTRYATMELYAYDNGYITLTGECLDEPKYYNLGDKYAD